jgi:hypothetical protein
MTDDHSERRKPQTVISTLYATCGVGRYADDPKQTQNYEHKGQWTQRRAFWVIGKGRDATVIGEF